MTDLNVKIPASLLEAPEGISAVRPSTSADWINARNAKLEELRQALDAVNGRASSFTLDGYHILALVRETERQLIVSGVPKARRIHTVVEHRPGGPTAKRYKYAAASTRVALRRQGNGTWVLTGAWRDEVQPKQAPLFAITLTRAARDAVIRHALRPFTNRTVTGS